MQGIASKNIILTSKLGTIIKNFDFIFCDFIKHPIASRIRDNINKITRIINITLNPTNRMVDTILLKLYI